MYFTTVVSILCMMIPILVSVALVTLLERKILSLAGNRLGPNKVLLGGVGQPFSDAVKLMKKQNNIMINFSNYFYYCSAMLMIIMALHLWILLSSDWFFSSTSLILMTAIMGVNCIGAISAGWSSFSKYSVIGSIRTVSLLISYESAMYLVIMCFMFIYFSFSLSDICVKGSLFSVGIGATAVFYVWWPSMLSDLNRTPYDFSEGESELVSGFNTEFGSSAFTLVFLAEYSNILFFSSLTSIFFASTFNYFGTLMTFVTIIWLRAVLARFRFDKLMMMAWKTLIPLATLMFLTLLSM